jgi:hypothetical protein
MVASLAAPDMQLEERRDLTGDGSMVRRWPTGTIGFYGDAYTELVRLSETIQRSGNLQDMVSASFVQSQIFRWAELRHDQQTPEPLCDFVLSAAGHEIITCEVWMAINELFLESPIKLGLVTLRTLDRESLDRWRSQLSAEAPAEFSCDMGTPD